VDTACGNIRFLGVHLKSKRDSDDADQDEMRRNEARLLRREIDAIFAEDPGTKLVVYGDLNDTRNTPAIREVHKPGKGAQGLLMMPLADSHGEHWTQHWDFQDVYSRIDYVMLSPALKTSVLWQESKIFDHPSCADASDHRPLLVLFTKPE
jgi:endonuclease/exonuclease/phosphatase family metal-dependent hydrolase